MDIGYNLALTVTPHDSTNIVHPGSKKLTDAVYIGGAGTLTVVWEDDSTTQFTCIAGQVLQVRVKRVNNTGTAATLIKALYQV